MVSSRPVFSLAAAALSSLKSFVNQRQSADGNCGNQDNNYANEPGQGLKQRFREGNRKMTLYDGLTGIKFSGMGL